MDLETLLRPEAIRVVTGATSKKRLFQDMAEIAAGLHSLSVSELVDALQERETLGPTGVGHGVALPHARIDGISSVSGVFLRLEKPLEYGAVDKAPVDLVFGLFAPRDAGVEHLKALALVSRTLRDPAICAKLRVNGDPAKLYAILISATQPKAA